MELTKYAHACVTLKKGNGSLVVDPGAFTPNAAELIADADAVLITHEHSDHFDEQALAAALDVRPGLKVYGPAAVTERWQDRGGQVVTVAAGEKFEAAGFSVAAFGGTHAVIHPDIPQVANVGFLIDETVYHPGDCYYAPGVPVRTLLVPTSGPWTKLSEAVDFVRAVGPTQAVQIHEIMLSDVGQQFYARFLSPEMLSSVPVAIVPPGETIAV